MAIVGNTPLQEPGGSGTLRSWEVFAGSRIAAATALGWGFAEATVFFVVPDVWIGLLTLFSWRAGLRAVVFPVI
ncbi:MAG TPA: hypothetical protein VK356_06675 [Thermomicrobiales bacterium]|nr:hypothetical protein [Thermomicrobiales bacterium]